MEEREKSEQGSVPVKSVNTEKPKDVPSEKKQSVTVESSADQMQRQLKRTKKMMLVAVIIVAILLIAGLLYGMYRWVYVSSSESAAREKIIQVLPLPVGTVNGKMLSFEQFEKRVAATKQFFQKQEELQLGLAENPGVEEVRKQEFSRMVDERLLEEIAKDRNITVTQEDVDAYFTSTILPQAAGGIDEVTQTLTDLYGWSVEDFKKEVLHETVLRNKVQESLSQDATLNEDAKKQIGVIYEDITKNGKSFEDAAKEKSEDTTSAQEGGKIGSISKGQTVEAFEAKAFAMNVGDISEPVQTEYGWHIIKVNAKDDAAQTVDVSHILIMGVTVDDLLSERFESAKVRSFIPGLKQ